VYAELHCHSCFSLLDGATMPEALVERAVNVGLHALALTDHNDLGGAVRFAHAAREAKFTGIIGAELTLAVGDDDDGTPLVTHLPLLAMSAAGYANLSTLITFARRGPRGSPCITRDQLASHTDGLFALTGGPRGWVPSLAARGETDAARDAAALLKELFGTHMAIECWDHGLPEERETTGHLIALARTLDIPWVVTNDVHYLKARDRMVHDVLSCLRHDKTLDTMGTRLRPNGEWYLKSEAQIARLPEPTKTPFA